MAWYPLPRRFRGYDALAPSLFTATAPTIDPRLVVSSQPLTLDPAPTLAPITSPTITSPTLATEPIKSITTTATRLFTSVQALPPPPPPSEPVLPIPISEPAPAPAPLPVSQPVPIAPIAAAIDSGVSVSPTQPLPGSFLATPVLAPPPPVYVATSDAVAPTTGGSFVGSKIGTVAPGGGVVPSNSGVNPYAQPITPETHDFVQVSEATVLPNGTAVPAGGVVAVPKAGIPWWLLLAGAYVAYRYMK